MKQILFAVTAALALSSCAGTRVVQTNYTSGALNPKKIYIREFGTAEYKGAHGGEAMKEIHKSQDGMVFANILKEELEKIAPTTVLQRGERPDGGWVVSGELEVVDAGCPWGRAVLGHVGVGRSGILVHVKVIDGDHTGHYDEKDGKGASSNTLYDFDVAGGSRINGAAGTEVASGLGYAPPFDFRNAAERIGKVLNPDMERYGARASASIR